MTMGTDHLATFVCMDTLVTIEVVNPASAADAALAVDRALHWFEEVESRCSRFDSASELRRLCATVSDEVAVSPLLFRAVEFALAVARETNGAFDPAVGSQMVRKGFNRDYRTGERRPATTIPGARSSYRDVVVDAVLSSVRLLQPLTLDLGAVAKGLAIDLATRELRQFPDFAINAGGDLYLAGKNARGDPWEVGIRHPRDPGALVETVRVSGLAVCTSGDYERVGADPRIHHILDAASGQNADAAISATAIAPSAMLADALATAAFVLGPQRGVALLARHRIEGMVISPDLEQSETEGFGRYRA
jgi:thiamine biosynthesis lipoprotein